MSTITTINPATEKEIHTYDIMTEKQATDRLESCHAAFLQWRELTHQELTPYLKMVGQKLRDNADELATLMTNETGKLLKDGHLEVELCVAIFDYTAENGPDALADEERKQALNGKRGVISYQPIGAIYSIQPWNFPLYQPVRVLADLNVKSSNTTDKINHPQLCQWLNDVASARDKKALTDLFQFFAPKIQRIARSKFPNEAQASEVVQETMSNVWRKAHLFDKDKGAATTWVYTVMRNVTFNMLRKIKGNKEDNLSDDIWPLAESQVSEDESFDGHLENKEPLSVIEQLPEAQQQVVKGFYFMEMSQEQLANHLNLPLGTIKSRLRLALAKLKVQLGENHD